MAGMSRVLRATLPVAPLVAGMVGIGLLGGCTQPRMPNAGSFVAPGTGGRMVSTDCLGPGQPDARGSWPDDDAHRFRFMPPGCSAATAIAQMVVDPADLVRGRPLPPGAALPVARAIEHYYDRSPDSQTAAPATPAGAASAAPASGSGSGQADPSAPAPATPAAAPSSGGDSAAGLLQGPLTTPATASPAPAP